MNNLQKLINKHIGLIQLFLILAFIIVSLIFQLVDNTEQLMITLIMFLGVDCFVVSVGYLNKIMEYMNNEEKMKLTTSEDIDLKHLIESAKSNVFISGSTLSSLSAVHRVLSELNPKVKLELYNIDRNYMLNNPELCGVINASTEQFNTRLGIFNNDVLSHLKSRENTYVFSVKAVSPITYIGIDTEKTLSSSVIIGMHYTLGNEYDIAWTAYPGSKLYQTYKTQIDELGNMDKEPIYIGKRD